MGVGVKGHKRGSRESNREAAVQGSNEGVLAWGGGGPLPQGVPSNHPGGETTQRGAAACPRRPASPPGVQVRTAVSGQALFHFTTISCSTGEVGRESSS